MSTRKTLSDKEVEKIMKESGAYNPYNKEIKGVGRDKDKKITVDVYSVLKAFGDKNPAIDHAIKKLLCGGIRNGKKPLKQDYEEAIKSIERAIEMDSSE